MRWLETQRLWNENHPVAAAATVVNPARASDTVARSLPGQIWLRPTSSGVSPPSTAVAIVWTSDPPVAAFFETLERQNRCALLRRVETAKKLETGVRRIATFVAMLKRRETIY